MSVARQGWIGMGLALVMLAAWLGLHIFGIFFVKLDSLLSAFVMVVVLTWLSVGIYIVAHDAMHGSLWPANRKVGDFVGALAVWLYAGFSFRRLLPKHHSHHRTPGSRNDPDFAPDAPHQALSWYWQFMRTYFGPREMLTMVLRVSVYVLLGARIENILLFFAVPGILSSFQLFYFGTFLPHRHLHDSSDRNFPDHHNARSNNFNYCFSLLSCFHFGYHHEHHLQPGIPWWRLPELRNK